MPEAQINGFKHHWEDIGEGEVLVMVHGAASAGLDFLPHAEILKSDMRLVMPDLRGMGKSDHVSSIPPSAWVDDLAALLDHLEIPQVHLIGNSLGARIVLRFAVDYPERVKSLVLDQPIVKNETAGNASLNSRMGSPDLLPEDVKQRRHLQHGDDWQQVVTNYFGIRNTPGLQEHYDLRESCKSVTAPTLITRGDTLEDVTHPLAHAFEFRNSLKNSNLWIKPEGGLFATPEGYDVLRKFVAQNSLVAASS